ncbi:hypothetical protein EB001_21305 [bacterium]|nr:hypothetical protein [bacterium]
MALPNDTHPFQLLGNDGNQYKVANSLRFRGSNSAYLTKVIVSSPTNNLKWTWSAWIKRGTLGTTQGLFDAYNNGSNFSTLMWDNGNTLLFYNIVGGVDSSVSSTPLYRDVSAWYHVMLVYDSANATQADRAILYVNGSKPAQTNPAGAFALNETTFLNNSSYSMYLGRRVDGNLYFDGYMAEVNFIDGQALTPSSFGQTDALTNQWVPKRYQGLEFTPYTATSGMLTQSGLQGFSAAYVVQDADTTDLAGAAFYTDTSAAGSYLQYDLGVGNTQEFRKVRVITDKPTNQGAYAVYNIQYSDDGTNWTTAFTSLDITSNNSGYGSTDVIQTQGIWGSVGAHRYWRLYKTNSATGGDYHRRVTFYTAKMSYTSDYGANGYYLPFSNLSTQTFGNTITYSQNLENAAWTKERATAGPNRLMAPDGTPTADKLYEDTTASNTHRAYIQSGTLTCYSVYAKAGERSAFALEAWNSSTAKYCYVNLATGTVISGSDTNATVTSVGNGWYRCSVTNVGTGSGGSTALYLMNGTTAGVLTYNGDGSSGMYFWGAQIEATTAGVPGPYLSTNGSGTSTYYPVSANESKYNKDINSNYNNFTCSAINIVSSNRRW